MKCKSGIYIHTQDQIVPCGQCMPCRINKGRLWSSRIIQEWAMHPSYSWFITLTYDEENCPQELDNDGVPVKTLRKKSFLQWVNNTRDRTHGFRYYAVGEYGEITKRPHYHMAVFPDPLTEITEITDRWKKGFTSTAEINHERARYLAAYTTKKLTDPTDGRLASNQEPEFRASSKNPPLGSAFVDSLCAHYAGPASKIIKQRGDIERTFRLDGRRYPLGDWTLKKARKALGIPELHRDRMLHPNYLDYHEIEEAEQCDQSSTLDELLSNKLKQGYHRGKGQKI